MLTRIYSLILLSLILPSCMTMGHAVSDLPAVHEEINPETSQLKHKFDVQRYGWFRGWVKYGWPRYLFGFLVTEKSAQQIEDPFSFCADRVRELSNANPKHYYELAIAAYWSGRIVLDDPYVMSKIYAAENLGTLGKPWVDAENLAATLNDQPDEYGETLHQQMNALAAIFSQQAKGNETATANQYRQWITQLANTKFNRPQEGLEVSLAFAQFARVAEDADFDLLVAATRQILARVIPQTLLQSIHDANAFVRNTSAQSLYQIGNKQALPILFSQLKNETDPVVRRTLISFCHDLTLEEAHQIGAIEFLAKAVRAGDGSVAVNAMLALSEITQTKTNLDREHWRAWWEEYLLHGKRGNS